MVSALWICCSHAVIGMVCATLPIIISCVRVGIMTAVYNYPAATPDAIHYNLKWVCQCFYPRDAMLARSLRQRCVRLSARTSVTRQYCAKTVHFTHSYYGTVIGNHMHAIEWCHFRWPWVTPDPGFKDTVVLKGEYLQSDAFYRHSYYIGRNRTP